MFGKSSVDISSLVFRATNVDLCVYFDSEKLAICRTQCYNRLVRFKNALQKVDEISGEIKHDFGSTLPLRVKRMAKDNSHTPVSKKSLDFGNPRASATALHVAKSTTETTKNIASPGFRQYHGGK